MPQQTPKPPSPAQRHPTLEVTDLGRIPYRDAFAIQLEHHQRVLAMRDKPTTNTPLGSLLLLEHDPPVITISRRPDAARHLIAPEQRLRNLGVTVEPTDRGGDITYHGPGQIVAYPIVDLNRANLRLHPWVRLLEQAVINTAERFNLPTTREPGATGVWTHHEDPNRRAKLAAIGVRVKRWVSMHGLAFNITTNLDHFDLIVPCGLAGRAVTSLERELPTPPTIQNAKQTLADELATLLREHTRDNPKPDPA